MSDQPPPPSAPPPPTGDDDEPDMAEKVGGSLLGVLVGLAIGLVLPPVVFGALAGLLDGVIPVGFVLLIAFGLGIALPLWLYLNVVRRFEGPTRRAMVITGYTCLGIWGVGLLLVGGCIALLVSLY